MIDQKELLDLQGCVIRCTGRYAILLDAVAMRLLRKYLVETFDLAATRPVFTQFGFTRGWRRMATIG